MKKTLIALAALATVGAASAQSSVTMFGIVDLAVTYGKGSGVGGVSRTSMNSSGLSSSQFGVRGVEDLGGGLSAGFHLEAAVSPDSGAGGVSNANNQTVPAAAANGSQGLTFARRSTISLMGGFGELRLGRDYTPHFWNNTRFDPFTTLGVGTSVQNIGHGANEATGHSNSAATLATFSRGLANPVSTRASNSIGYFLPGNLGGFYGQAMYHMGENTSGAATSKDGRGASLRLGYAAGPIDVAVGWGGAKYATTATTGDVKTVNIGASYDFGVAKLMGSWGRDTIDATASTDITGFVVGVTAPVGAGLIRAAVSQSTVDTAGAATDPKIRKIALGYVHNLSKRTAVYTTFARLKNSGGSALGLNTTASAPNASSTGLDIGVRHSF